MYTPPGPQTTSMGPERYRSRCATWDVDAGGVEALLDRARQVPVLVPVVAGPGRGPHDEVDRVVSHLSGGKLWCRVRKDLGMLRDGLFNDGLHAKRRCSAAVKRHAMAAMRRNESFTRFS